MPIDWVALAGVVGALLVVLIPIIGLTARFALKPIVESFRAVQGSATRATLEDTRLLERLDALAERLDGIENDVRRLGDAREFDEKLLEGPS
ncbi:MAG: hypothetical protein RRA92_03495 [Gemmatimonadota bacterium]|nr:hypothetical protein [Gemmatimonadota bacterium]